MTKRSLSQYGNEYTELKVSLWQLGVHVPKQKNNFLVAPPSNHLVQKPHAQFIKTSQAAPINTLLFHWLHRNKMLMPLELLQVKVQIQLKWYMDGVAINS